MNDFLERLAKSLKHIDEDERTEILQDYREHFEIGLASGKTENEVLQSLGDPEQLAKMYTAMGATQKAHKSKGLADAMRMVGAIAGYKFGGGLLMGSLYFGCVISLFVLFITAAALAAVGAGGIGLAVYEWVLGYVGYGFAALFTGIVLGSVGILGWIGTARLWKMTIGNLPRVATRIMNKESKEE